MTAARPPSRQAGHSWLACGASVIGAHHRLRGLGCDDAYGFGVVGDFVVAAVADGAGSVTGTSAWGAHVACRSVLDDALDPVFVRRYRTGSAGEADRMVRWLFAHALERVQSHSGAMGLDLAMLSTTLSVAVAGGDQAVFGQIGDGVIALEDHCGIRTVLVEQKDEYANTTSFIQSDGAMENALRTVALDGVTAFALSTDGMSYKITDVATGAAFQPFFRGCWQQLRSGASPDHFGAVLGGIEDDQTGDDKAMVLAVAGSPAESRIDSLTSATAECSPPPSVNVAVVGATEPDAPAATAGGGRRKSRRGRPS
jgi:Protein phosphatase 2C